jgi:transcriptional regulator with XRE-family HTH domain
MAELSLAGSVHTAAYTHLLSELVEARKRAGLSQAQVAHKIGKPASFVGKYELGERRLDVIELLIVLKSVNADGTSFISDLAAIVPDQL